jgi:phospholipase C
MMFFSGCGMWLDRSSGSSGSAPGGSTAGSGNPGSPGGSGSTPTGGPGTGSPGSNTSGIQSVNHVVYMIMENRSFDHYFAKMNEYRAANGIPGTIDELPPGVTNPRVPDYKPVGSFHLTTMCIENTSAAWLVSHQNFNLFNLSSDTPTMDGFVWSASAAAFNEGGQDTSGSRAMGYYDGNDLPYY